jgi:SWI/SNF-related matrix-associated actin-dependent regulator of chromatin subfamily A containing DEAD/H box 1
MRPFFSVKDLKSKLGQGRNKAGPAGISPRMFEDCIEIFEGYGAVDSILEDCEKIGSTIRAAIASWTPSNAKGKAPSTADVEDPEEGALTLASVAPLKASKATDFLEAQQALLAPTVQLKEYQLIGVNWLQLLYRRKLSCILADEMGKHGSFDSTMLNTDDE